jgi:hypothetical protein
VVGNDPSIALNNEQKSEIRFPSRKIKRRFNKRYSRKDAVAGLERQDALGEKINIRVREFFFLTPSSS